MRSSKLLGAEGRGFDSTQSRAGKRASVLDCGGLTAHSKTWRNLVAALPWLVSLPVVAEQYAVPWFAIHGGGGASTGGVYAVSGAIGTVAPGRSASTNAFRLESGFWAIALQQIGFPLLQISGRGTAYTVTWSTTEPGLVLQQADSLDVPIAWADVPGAPTVDGTTNTFTLTVPANLPHRFYRLRRP